MKLLLAHYISPPTSPQQEKECTKLSPTPLMKYDHLHAGVSSWSILPDPDVPISTTPMPNNCSTSEVLVMVEMEYMVFSEPYMIRREIVNGSCLSEHNLILYRYEDEHLWYCFGFNSNWASPGKCILLWESKDHRTSVSFSSLADMFQVIWLYKFLLISINTSLWCLKSQLESHL